MEGKDTVEEPMVILPLLKDLQPLLAVVVEDVVARLVVL
jgi:hypothetical protein